MPRKVGAVSAGAAAPSLAPGGGSKPRQTRARTAPTTVVDEETRQALKRARLEALEAHNFIEGGVEPGGIEDEDFYIDDLDMSRKAATVRQAAASRPITGPVLVRKPGVTPASSGAGASSSSASSASASASGSARPPIKLRKLHDVLAYELGPKAAASLGGGSSTLSLYSVAAYGGATERSQHYVAAAAGRPTAPARPFCAVCGFDGPYTCTRCGSRYCSRACSETHASKCAPKR